MNSCTRCFPPLSALLCLSFLAAFQATGPSNAHAQTPEQAYPNQKTSLKAAGACVVPAAGEVTAFIKNGVELSLTDDWDCDGVADAYDNCVGMSNPPQVDSDGNGIGDICESATFVKAGVPVKPRSNVKAKSRTAKAEARRPRAGVRRQRSRPENTKPTKQ